MTPMRMLAVTIDIQTTYQPQFTHIFAENGLSHQGPYNWNEQQTDDLTA